MFFDPGLNSTSSLSNVHLSTLKGDAVYALYFYGQVVLNRTKETVELPRWKSHDLDTMF
jgi:hypothetical protein